MEPVRDPIPERWQTIADVFAQASELAPEEREAYLRRSGAGPETIDEVRRLLELADSAASYFEKLGAGIGSIATPGRLAAGHVLSGRFRVVRYLAGGGMGEVYEAEDLDLGGRVALKVLKPAVAARDGALERFRDEIRLARSVNSAAVCRVFDVARDVRESGEELVYFTMELLDGETIAERLKRSKWFTEAEARPVIAQMAAGLDAAHRAGILHRDFKSGNVMLCGGAETPRAVITDFGLSRPVRPGDAGWGTADGATPAYVSPEQLEGGEETARTDIYSFGVVLYEMMTGTVPFRGGTALEIARRRLEERARPPRELRPDLPAAWNAAILRCLERDPAKRFGGALEVADALGCGGRGSSRRAWLLGAAASVATAYAGWSKWGGPKTVELPSVAVLPFDAGDAGVAYLAEGLADRLTDALTSVPGLRILSRSAAQRLPDIREKLAESARKLRVGHVVGGSVKRAGGRLHVTAEVVEASTGFQVWAGTYDIDEAESDALSGTLSRAVIHTLAAGAQPAVLTAAGRRLTQSAEAYREYLLARHFAPVHQESELKESIERFEAAIRLDPGFAEAHAGLAFAAYNLAARSAVRDALVRKSLDAAGRALRIDPRNAEAYLAIACNQRMWEWNWAAAEENFRRALRLNESLVEGHRMYSVLLSRLGRHEEALEHGDKAVALDPLNPGLQVSRGTVLLYAGRAGDALEQFQTVLREHPDYQNAYIPMADALAAKGRRDEAIEACRRAAALTNRLSYTVSNLGRLYGMAGRTTEAKAIAQELEERHARNDASPTDVAYVYLGLGDREKAFEWLERGIAARNPNVLLLKVGPEYDGIRSDPRYAPLLARLRL